MNSRAVYKMNSTADETRGGRPQKTGGKDHKKPTAEALRGAIQLGIGYTVGNMTSKPDRDVLMQDFYVVESVFLPRYYRTRSLRGRGGIGDSKRQGGQKVLYSTARESIQGDGKAAETLPDADDDTLGGIPAKHKDEKLLIFLGIIDILQSYRFIKKVEHSWKALVHDGDTVSVHRPNFYADRFLKFMGTTVFKKIHPLRGASSRKKKNSIQPCRSASQEFLSTVKEESQEERRAQSLENLDDTETHSSQKPDVIPSSTRLNAAISAATMSSNSSLDDVKTESETRDDRRTSSSTLALEDSTLLASDSQASTPESGLDVYL
ncbi:phosphatidylinositol 4-phosphate 5-kinase type-1 beta-like [Sinocyclocheilus grahami]|uniref:phosphatidylinositol 4-phosphate 5-kinase type-1 beta-like n=1 Tax=Sinocyclocheilus grahami TaxID=75366 RepID=UPI0007AD0DAA|nr:PREDICTED: phosphatidylinositol 4-phosphate 5-kinase type-1 beta-like [Sinocyclocheilus grahami]